MSQSLMTPAEVASLLNVKESQVYTLMRSGQLRALKIGHRGVWRVHQDDLDEYIHRLREEAKTRRAEDMADAEFEEAD